MGVPDDFSERDRLDWIFLKQWQLIEKFLPIEQSNGRTSLQHPVNIDTRQGQAIIKDFLWRITEEVIEAKDAYEVHCDYHHSDVIEELSDAFHFIIELCMLIGIRPNAFITEDVNDDKLEFLADISPVPLGFEEGSLRLITYLGRAGNELKARPWKRGLAPLTNRAILESHTMCAFQSLMGLFKLCGCNGNSIFRAYFDKNTLNHKRIENAE